MNWSILLGIALIAYAAFMLIRHVKRVGRGDCSSCPYASGCGGGCKK